MRVAAGELGRHTKPVLVALACTVVAALPPFLTGGVGVELQQDLGLSVRDLGIAISAYFAASAMSSAGLGHLAQRLGARWSLAAATTASATAMLGIASWVRSLGGLLACLALGGLANALTHPSVNGFLAEGISRRHLGVALGLKQSAIPIAALVSGASISALVVSAGWRAAFLAGAALALLMGASVLRLRGLFPGPASTGGRRSSAPLVLGLLGTAAGLGSFGGTALGTFLVSASVVGGVSPGDAGLLLAGGSALCVGVRVCAGLWVDRAQVDAVRVVIALLAIGSLGFLGLATGAGWLLIASSLVAFGAGWGWPGIFQFAVVSRNPGAPRIATGITQTGTYLGAAVGPLAFGTLATHSYSTAWTVTTAALVAGAVLAMAALWVEQSRAAAAAG